jgi:Ca2+-transporting ATPase
VLSASWHAESVVEALARLESEPQGLDDVEAARRLGRFGPNRLTPPKPVSAAKILGDQLRSVVVLLLLGAVVISVFLGDHLEAAAIATVLAINALIGFVTELRAHRAMEALLQFDMPRASVLRSGHLRTEAADQLVPGDVVELNAGQHVPADGRLIHSTDLRVIEAALTGESLPVSKAFDLVLPLDTPLAERRNMVYKGTTIGGGTARAVVTATGQATELGRIGVLVGSLQEERTPLERRLDALGRRLVWLALAVAALVAALGRVQGVPLGLVVQTGIALAVAAVPEALPAVATIALAVGLRRMARRHALVRRLPAVEALGSTTVVCTDKTRTLTSGEMSVVRVWTAGEEFSGLDNRRASGPGSTRLRRALEVAALASRPQAQSKDGSAAEGDPVDLAVQRAAEKVGIGASEIARQGTPVGILPFSSERKLMASFHETRDGVMAYVKGAPRQVLALADRVLEHDDERTLDDEGRRSLLDVNEAFARSGLRVLAMATGRVGGPGESGLRGLTFVGFLGLMDPPAPGVKATIERLRGAGLRTVMLTGDQRLTAEAVGRELGLLGSEDRVIDGRELDTLSGEELRRALSRVGAFSRVTPEHKLILVKALQEGGDVVAMLGDGVNDAAALRKADVGVAMGLRGTDVAKEAASIVLQDDRFETIAAAVEEGRVIYDNIRKFVFYLFSCNVAEVLVLLVAGVGGWPLPLLPLQILWLNMVTDTFPALSLAMEPGDPDVMTRPPRNPQEAILSRRFIGGVLFYGTLITASTLTAFFWTLSRDPARAASASFMTLALAQIFHLGNARGMDPVLHPARAMTNRYALWAVGLALGLQFVAMYVDALAGVLAVERLDAKEWFVVLSLGAVPAIVGQTLKMWRPGAGDRDTQLRNNGADTR